MKYRLSGIEWDVADVDDSQRKAFDLPDSLVVDIDDSGLDNDGVVDAIVGYLADEYGFLAKSFHYEK